MIIAKKVISRRTLLRGAGAAIALPWLDCMVPAFAGVRERATPIRRFGVVYLPNGMAMPYWTPPGDDLTFTPILKPLERFRDRLLLVSGLTGRAGGGSHSGASTPFLSGALPKPTQNSDIQAEESVDQVMAREFSQHTQLASIEMGLDSSDFAGACALGYSCIYTNTISWRSATLPLLMENNPRRVFERLFGDSANTDPAARLARIRRDQSILDSITEKAASYTRRLGPGDRLKLSEYLDAIRDVERRIRKAEEQSTRELPVADRPAGIPDSTDEHAKQMYDLQVLAFQADLTRVATFMIGREFSGRTYKEIGVPDGHHTLSHHQEIPGQIEKLSKINTYHTSLFEYFLDKLQKTPDGDGSLLDQVIVLYGAGLSNSDKHARDNLPLLLAGGGAGRIKGGRHLTFAPDTPMANLLVTLLDKMDVPLDRMGNSTGELPIDTLADV